MVNNNIEYWQKMAGFYTPFMKKNKKIYEAICREVEPELNRKMTVLELACGNRCGNCVVGKKVSGKALYGNRSFA